MVTVPVGRTIRGAIDTAVSSALNITSLLSVVMASVTDYLPTYLRNTLHCLPADGIPQGPGLTAMDLDRRRVQPRENRQWPPFGPARDSRFFSSRIRTDVCVSWTYAPFLFCLAFLSFLILRLLLIAYSDDEPNLRMLFALAFMRLTRTLRMRRGVALGVLEPPWMSTSTRTDAQQKSLEAHSGTTEE
ncbi:uncharacterized protein BDZ83DRAFT_18161 [Colletotrichum acutatum]|uniref:Uncharacterized protein n=1 Tax=Glomerella acutata TaxID=27357 RepID=A0AAD8XB64_GLOAC|nr:uncharacterized protein BDZ83DRAFT_18161 [Colletotrichum acutatum]KAK1718784.1 hypothetical protein BDZ83DRAFT_18161 [Colletotrichum acutatum]